MVCYSLCRGRGRPLIRHVSSAAVHRGTAFEERSLKLLQENLSMSLQRVGGKEDGGIDLQGWWWLPSAAFVNNNQPIAPRRLRVIAQCKAEKKKTSPKYVRELEGVMLRFLALSAASGNAPLYDGHTEPGDIPSAVQFPLVALLISESPFTRSTLLRAHSSPLPLFLLHIPALPEAQSRLWKSSEGSYDLGLGGATTNASEDDMTMGSAFWNPALSGSNGVLGGEMEIRWERSVSARYGQPCIWWRNRRLENWVPGTDASLKHL